MMISAIISAVKFVTSLARHQHWFDIVAKPNDVIANFLSYPAPSFLFQFCPKRNHLICLWHWLPLLNLIRLCSVFLWS